MPYRRTEAEAHPIFDDDELIEFAEAKYPGRRASFEAEARVLIEAGLSRLQALKDSLDEVKAEQWESLAREVRRISGCTLEVSELSKDSVDYHRQKIAERMKEFNELYYKELKSDVNEATTRPNRSGRLMHRIPDRDFHEMVPTIMDRTLFCRLTAISPVRDFIPGTEKSFPEMREFNYMTLYVWRSRPLTVNYYKDEKGRVHYIVPAYATLQSVYADGRSEAGIMPREDELDYFALADRARR